jgi:DNA-binding transcriptional ArsR family regulator
MLNKRELGPFTVEPVKLRLQATKAGVFTLNPEVVYIDDVGETKKCKSRPITLTVQPMLHAKIGEETISVPILPDRVATGFADLDALLFGGIPENYAVILTSPPTDEKELLIKRFLETGTKAHITTIYFTTEPESAKALAKEFPSDFHLFICNPRAEAIIQSLPNTFKFKGVENLTEIDIALGVSRALAKVHLKKLEKAGLVKSRVVLADGEAKALRYYELRDFDIRVSPQTIRKEVEKNGQ